MLILKLKKCLQKGDSVLKSVQKILQQPMEQSIYCQLMIVIRAYQDASCIDWAQFKNCSTQRRALFLIIQAGLQGKPIFDQLCRLEEETLYQIEIETEEFLATLPIHSMLPLTFLIFPAFMLLLLGPLIHDFFNMLGAN